MGPIEPAAITAATLLATKALEALGGKAGEITWAGMGRLAALVRRTVTGHRQAETAVAEVEHHPDDQDRVRELGELLAAFAAQNASFRRELVELVADARRDPTIGSLATQVYGQAQVGQILNIGQARDIYIQPPAAAPASVWAVPWPTRHRTVANLPPRNPVFTGRTDLLARLEHDLVGQGAPGVVRSLALHGLGGVGKTHLVLEYAHRHTAAYDLLWWITAEQPATIAGQLATLARRLGIPEASEQAEAVAALLDELRHHDRWLLVFDNAEQPGDLRPFWPPGGGGHVLVTSRNPSWAGLATPIAVEVLPRPEAIAFLSRRAALDEQAASALAQDLGDLPLALEQAAAYLDETGTPASEYLDLVHDRAPELLALGQPATSEQTIATTWTLALDRIRAQSPVAQDLLSLCAFLAPDDLPRALLIEHPEVLPERLAGAVRDRLAIQGALGALRRYSLITTTGDALRMHRLVQAVTRRALAPVEQQEWATVAVRLVLAGFPERADDANTWPTAVRLLPHALTATSHPAPHVTDPEATVSLLSCVSAYLWGRGEFPEAKWLCEQAIATAEVRLGPDHPTTASSLHTLAHIRQDQGDLDHARALHARALASYETHFGPDHPTTGHSLNNLGEVLYDLGDLAAARPLLERALAISETHLGPNDLGTAGNLTGFALLLRAEGNLDPARTHLERALAIQEAQLGPDDPATGYSHVNLGVVLHELGDLDGARTHLERALAIYETNLGPKHPRTAHSLNNLARVLQAQGDLSTARSLLERALHIRETRLGADHPDTARVREDLTAVVAELEKSK